MEKLLSDFLPIMDVEHDCILSKQGDITTAFRVTLPEIFTGSSEDFESWHQGFIKATRILPKDTIFHKQDWFLKTAYSGDALASTSFLTQSSEKYFFGRPFQEHDSFIMLTKMPSGRKPSSSVFSSLLRPTLVPEQTISPVAIQEFEDIAAGTATKAIKRAAFGVNVERRSFLAVKWAQSNHISAVALKIYI